MPRSRASSSTGEPAGTRASTSAMETSTRSAPSASAGSAESASSMSVVLGPSMVTVGTSRRSRRLPESRLTPPVAIAASITEVGKMARMPWRTTQRSRPRSAPAATVRAGTTRAPRIAATTNAPSAMPSAAPSSKAQSVLDTSRSTWRKRRLPWVTTLPKSSVRVRSTSVSDAAVKRVGSCVDGETTALTMSPSRKGLSSGGVMKAATSPSGVSRSRKPKPRG